MSRRWSTTAMVVAVLVATVLVVAACGSNGDGDPSGVIDDGIVPPPPEVDGTAWQLTGGGGPGGDVVAVDGFPITISFDADQVSGSAGCNTYTATYRHDGNDLSIEALTQTEIGCEPAVMTAEAAYVAALLDVSDVTVSGGQLALGSSAAELLFAPQL